MTNKQLIFVFLIVLPCILEAQKSWHPESFFGISKDYKFLYIKDNFSYPSDSWPELTYPSRTAVIQNGKYQLIANTRRINIRNERINFPKNENFELHVKLQVFQASDLILEQFVAGMSFCESSRACKNPALSAKRENILTIRRIDQDLYFFVNKRLTRKTTANQLASSLFFYVPETAKLDWLDFEMYILDNQEHLPTPLTVDNSNPRLKYQRKLAYVIGNAQYDFATSLNNPLNDADSMAFHLRQLGFEVQVYKNLKTNDFEKVLARYKAMQPNYDVALLFYAGHGIQANGLNYLIPSDAHLVSSDDIARKCIRADYFLPENNRDKLNILILDACRDNPLAENRTLKTTTQGLLPMNAPVGSLIAYATSPGSVASDGNTTNGLYTAALIQHLNTPNIDISELFRRVRVQVLQQSRNTQIPWETSSMKSNFYFNLR